ncbi:MAG: hypothetical protein KDI98_06760 [Hyphomicrobiaceae bacterium]|nr:hypothetical protein [Hyphomicrobiaceae bacterium]
MARRTIARLAGIIAASLALAACQSGGGTPGGGGGSIFGGRDTSGAFRLPPSGQSFVYSVTRNGRRGEDVVTQVLGADGYRISAARPGVGNFSVVLFCVWCGHPATASYTPNYNDVWPLRAGTDITVLSTDGTGQQLDNTIRVVGIERITVPAGTYDAWRVEEGAGGGGFARTTWWAPQLGYVVRTQVTRGDDAGEVRELARIQ